MAKLLIVDDSETLRTQLRRDLESGGHTVIEGADGIEGLQAISENSDIRLIICDLNMPRMDGLAMCEKVQALATKPPIIMMTTESSPELKTQGKSRGVIAWITKPYAADKLLLAIEKIVK